MSTFRDAASRDTVLFINGVRKPTFAALETYEANYDKKLKILVFVDLKKHKAITKLNKQKASRKITVVAVDFDSPIALKEALTKYEDRFLAVTCQFENSIPEFKKIIPLVPYLDAPTQSSLEWSTDKIMMRRLLKAHDRTLVPKYTVIEDASAESIAKAEQRVGYPLVVKPAGLAASLLVSVSYHREELEENLKKTVKTIDKIYKQKLGRGNPRILVEQLMEGAMYSIDVYVNGRGMSYATPPVHVKTGRAVGFDDFFGYQRLTPTKLLASHVEDATQTAFKAVRAMGLRSTTAHVELMRTEKAWKVIEIAPRMGGYRHDMYNLSFGINHILNDLLIRIPQKPVIRHKRKGFTAVFNMYAKTEGKLKALSGLKKVRSLESFYEMDVNKVIGDELKFAKNGGSPILEITLFNESRSSLMADIRRMEKAVVFTVNPKNHKKSV